jgi:uncharacterized protein (DUF1800 family)
VREIGVWAFIEEQLAPENLNDTLVERLLNPIMPILNENGGVLARQFAMQPGEVASALLGATTARAAMSERQLFERMVQFWSDHFSVFIGKEAVLFLKIDDDRTVTRAKGMSRFRELLGASARSPAMLIYLDNARSERSAPNENYARELMELHTLGVNGGYTEDDVKEVARCFTGWSVSGRQRNPGGRIEYEFRTLFHDDGEKIVLGTVIPAGGGEQDGETVLDLLAGHPSTARFVATKLARRFIADRPPETAVDAIATTFSATDGDMRATLRALFDLPDFWSAPPKFKQPFEYAISLLRAVNATIIDTQLLVRAMRVPLDTLGNIPFTWPAPNGFPDVMGAWQSGLLTRWNLALAAASGNIPGAESDTTGIITLLEANGVPLEIEPVLSFMGEYLFGREITPEELDIVIDFGREVSREPADQISAGLILMLASPAFQYR